MINNRYYIYVLLSCFIVSLNLSAKCPLEEAGYQKICNVDSIKFYMPIYDGLYTTNIDTRYTFICRLNESDVPFHLLYDSSDRKLISDIRNAINRAAIKDPLPYDTSSYALEAYVKSDLNKWVPGLHWLIPLDPGVLGCAVIYCDDNNELIWFGLDYVDIYDLRLECNLFDLLKNNSTAK